MKITKSEVSLIPQEKGIEGMLKLIELTGRVAYKSEDRITEDSYQKFVDMIKTRGHWAVLSLGTVYLSIPFKDNTEMIDQLKATAPYTKWCDNETHTLITTNYRVVCQLGIEDAILKFIVKPLKNHYHRVTVRVVCSRVIAQEILRHRVFCPVMESTRYVNYSKEKVGSEITYILPEWVKEEQNFYGHKLNIRTRKPQDYLLELDGQDLWNALIPLSGKVAARDVTFKAAEKAYMAELKAGLKPEDARGVLPLDTKTELCITGWVEDFTYTPPTDSPEKAGFFNLRLAKSAHPDVRVLAEQLQEIFVDSGIDKLK